MSSDSSVFTGENLNDYLKAVAKEYKKMGGKAMPAELILIGGAAVIANYGFREMTTDIDAIIHAASVMKDAINSVGDQYHLQNGWLNTDFMRTASYSPKLDQYSTYYRTFGGILSVRTVQLEYLIAMKLRSGRLYKNVRSISQIFWLEHEKRGEPITMDQDYCKRLRIYTEAGSRYQQALSCLFSRLCKMVNIKKRMEQFVRKNRIIKNC